MEKKKKPYNNLINLREKHNLKQKDVANLLFVSTRTYCHYENGERNVPTEVWKKLSSLYNTSIDYLCETNDDYQSKK